MVPMHVHKVGLDWLGKFLVILADEEERRLLPIWIGWSEASSIALALRKEQAERPLTHDLLKSVIEHLNVQVTRMAVTKLDDGTFYALLTLSDDETETPIDARPSDAIALALRTEAPIFVAEEVLEEAGVVSEGKSEEDMQKFRELIEKLHMDDTEA